ncbi:MAG: hypothetical protein J6Q10_00100 [Clostridia bacterium]|nr:hypothetical protein [Clostridia bacterium]
MIIEGKKNSAFDLMDAVMKLSDLYHENNHTRSISIFYSGGCEAFDVNIFDDIHGRRKLVESVTIYLDEKDFGGTFEAAFEMIEKEMEQYE